MVRKVRKKKTLKSKLAKPKLKSEVWLGTTSEVKLMRESIAEANGGYCELTGEVLKNPSLDHDHSNPPLVRGVISQHCNTMEGYILKYFNRYCKRHTELSISNFLRKMADYYEKDWYRGLHYRAVSDYQERLCRMTIPQLQRLVKEDYSEDISAYKEKKEYIEFLTQKYVEEMEYLYSKINVKEVKG